MLKLTKLFIFSFSLFAFTVGCGGGAPSEDADAGGVDSTEVTDEAEMEAERDLE